MLIVGDEKDRTGTTLSDDEGLIEIKVVQKAKDAEIYLLVSYPKSEPAMVTGGYLVTANDLEVIIAAYETGLWLTDIE